MTRSTRSTRSPRTPGAPRLARLAVAGGLLLSVAPMTALAPSAHAEDEADGAATTAYGGYTSSSFATPLRIEVFEPSIPIPVDAGVAQLEFNLGYSKVKADSGSSQGKASYLWPGDPVGDGLKTFAEQLGFPPSPLTDGGYPVQANSQFPGDTPTQTDTTVPGGIMRTTSGDKIAVSETGFSPDGALAGPDTGSGGGDGAGGGEPTTNMLLDLLSSVGGLLSGGLGGVGGAPAGSSTAPGSTTAPADAAAPGGALPGLPAPLAALIDVDGYVSVSKMTAVEGPVVSAARATLGEVKLLGGLVTLGGIETVAKATSDGTKGEATGSATWGKLSIAGQAFEIGPDGITAAGQKTPIPGLRDNPAKALGQLGISIEVPEPTRTVEGDLVKSVSESMRIVLDASVLSPLLQLLPTGVLAELIPAQAGPLKGVVASLSSLASKVVITLGVASSTVETVPPITFDSAGAEAPAEAPGAEAPAAAPAAAGGGSAGGAAPGVAPAPLGGAPTDGGAPIDAAVAPAAATSGLPALFSIPGMLLLAAFAAAAVAGSWFRRIGVAALGGGASCSHGLDSGLPDLRKA